jgi:3-isopropylmalate/(R)-2-methylmalate dehydratase small subunit
MNLAIEGAVHTYGDGIDTDILAPGAYLKGSIEVMASHCLEAIDADFVRRARPGDVICAGRQFGIGSSREQAAHALLLNGIRAVLAISFGRIFYRNALNLGLPALICPSAGEIPAGTRLSVDPVAGIATEVASGRRHACTPIPPHLMQMIADGGLLAHLEKRLVLSHESRHEIS